MMIDINKADCCGCSACVAICSTNAITMKLDEKGFLYPHIDKLQCIKCNRCSEVCTAANNNYNLNSDNEETRGYGAYAKDLNLRMESSSGGIFSLLAIRILNNGGCVIGAAMSDDCYEAKHIVIENQNDLYLLRGSKYLQSSIGDTYSIAQERLKQGQYVLFSGTPCQINGLKAYLNREYDKLITVDFVCHGVPSPQIWRKYCKEIERKNRKKINRVNFRNKTVSWLDFGLELKKQKTDYQFKTKYEDPYLRLFLKNYTICPSCFSCRHKGLYRKSDVTLADFWGVNKIHPEFSDGKGISLVITHTRKGDELLKSINAEYISIDPIEAIKFNKAAITSAKSPLDYDLFWNMILNENKKSIEYLANRFTPMSIRTKTKILLMKTGLYEWLRGGVR